MFTDIFQPTHLLFVLVVALLVLGPKRLPEVARQLGNGLRDFRSAINGESNERHDSIGPYESGYESPQHSFEHAEPPLPTESHEFAHSEPAPTGTDSQPAPTVADTPPAPTATGTPPAPNGDEAVTAAPGEPSAGKSNGHEFAHESTDSTAKSPDTSA